MILHPSTYEIILIIIFVSLAIFTAGIICYKRGAIDGYEEAIDDNLKTSEALYRYYNDLMVRYDALDKEKEALLERIDALEKNPHK